MSDNIPFLFKRVMAYGIRIYPFQLDYILQKYAKYHIPNDDLCNMDGRQIQLYVDALILVAQEDARDWTRGMVMLEELGFVKHERIEGHRAFVSMEYKGQQ